MIKHLTSAQFQRRFIKQTELKILFLKNIITFHSIINNPLLMKYLLNELYSTLSSFTSRSNMKNVCVLTGRTRAIYRKTFHTTRMQVREKTQTGFIPGIRKSSW